MQFNRAPPVFAQQAIICWFAVHNNVWRDDRQTRGASV